MSVSLSVSEVRAHGVTRTVYGTFTSAELDSTVSLLTATHGLGAVDDAMVSLDSAAVGSQRPKITISGSSATAVFDDLRGQSGRWSVTGRM